jgi:hypothetical protein|tara:strand:+ start:245 stop:481 length:237 start_codon:yes stop_codon:yes gene_type:complete
MAKIDNTYLAIMQLDSNELEKRRHELTPEGKLIRKEITRRNKINYWKGPFAEHKGGRDGVMQTPSVVGTVRTYIKGSK